MFSGVIAFDGVVRRADIDLRGGLRLSVAAPHALRDGVEPKDSVAVNGVCLTAAAVRRDEIEFDVVPETLGRSTLGALRAGERVNLELSLRLGERMGGHFVYGHIDGTAPVRAVVPEGQGARMSIELPLQLRRYIVEKGYVALDGVSVTVAAVNADAFEIALIPETLTRTTLGARAAGDLLNVEIDPIARYALAPVG